MVPGGFSYGDYLRAGAIARFAPVMGEVIDRGGPWTASAGNLQRFSGAVRSRSAARRADPQRGPALRLPRPVAAGGVDDHGVDVALRAGADLLVPLKSGEGRYVASETVLDKLEAEGRVVFRYRDNPNGSMRDIAGICSANRRVVGLMPHPEHATEPLTGPSDDGLGLFYSALDSVLARLARCGAQTAASDTASRWHAHSAEGVTGVRATEASAV